MIVYYLKLRKKVTRLPHRLKTAKL